MANKEDQNYDFSGLEEPTQVVQPSPEQFDFSGMESLPTEEPGQIEALLRGSAQGATFGGSDELVGAGEATYDKLKELLGGPKAKSWLEAYRQHQKESEAANEAAKKAHEYTYMGGELAGGIGAGVATAGAGGLSGAGLKAAASRGGGALAAELGLMGAEGAALGGAQGALSSKGTLGSEEFKKDARTGAIIGGVAAPVMGAALEGAGEGIKKGMSALKESDSPYTRQLTKSLEKGLEGKKFTGDVAKQELLANEEAKALDITKRIMEGRKQYGQQISNAVDRATQEGVRVKLSDDMLTPIRDSIQFLKENPLLVGSKDSEKLQAFMTKALTNNDLSPIEARALRDEMIGLSSKIDDPILKRISNSLKSGMDDALEQVPGYSEANKAFYEYNKMVPEILTNKGVPEEISSKLIGDKLYPEEDLYKSVKQLIERSGRQGSTSDKNFSSLQKLSSNLEKLGNADDSIVQKVGLGSKQVKSELQDISDMSAIRQRIEGTRPEKTDIPTSFGGLVGDIGYSAANLTGRSAKTVGNAVFKLPEASLRSLGEQVSKISPEVGGALINGLSSRNEYLKNAALFSIMQNPSLRHLIPGSNEGEDQK